MTKFILTYRGYGDSPGDVESRISTDEDLQVVERFGNNLVVEGPGAAMRRFLVGLHGWLKSPERRIKRPRMMGASR